MARRTLLAGIDDPKKVRPHRQEDQSSATFRFMFAAKEGMKTVIVVRTMRYVNYIYTVLSIYIWLQR